MIRNIFSLVLIGGLTILFTGCPYGYKYDDSSLTINNKPSSWQDYEYTDSLFSIINTGYNEYGPVSVPFYLYSDSGSVIYIDMIAYSNDETGNQDLKIAWFFGDGINSNPDEGICEGPKPVMFLNSISNDEYLAFYGPG